jgi:diaminopimelate epimerase
MGTARLASEDFPTGPADGVAELTVDSEAPPGAARWRFQYVSIGNPQCAIAVEDAATLAALDLDLLGPPIEGHHNFPNRTNVSWYAELERGPPARIRARIFERGVGETLSSGTGATGAAIAYLLAAGADRTGGPASVVVVLDGGELEVEVDGNLHVHLSGWALPVFAGSLSEEFVKELQGIG